MFQGQCIRLIALEDGMVELCVDRQGESINKLDARTVEEFREATRLLAADASVRGVLVTSGKNVFILLGVGFPAYAGGPLKYADWLGLGQVVALCGKHAALGGPQYAPTPRMRELAASGGRYYPV